MTSEIKISNKSTQTGENLSVDILWFVDLSLQPLCREYKQPK